MSATAVVTDRAPRLAPAPAGAAPPRERARRVDVGGLGVHVRCRTSERVGDGAPVVLVHGLGVASRMCQPAAEHLALRHHVYAPDLPGFGLSDEPGEVLDIAGLGAALAGTVEALGLRGAVLAGTSLGCQVAAAAAARDPARSRLLVLGSPTVDDTRRRWRSQLWRWALEQAGHSLRLRRIMAADIARCGPGRVLRTFSLALHDAIEDEVGRAPQPVLVCWASRDPLVSRAWAARLAGGAARGRLAVLPGARHALSHESPLQFARAIAGFVDEHASEERRP